MWRRDGCENAFLLHVSLHPVSRKMFVQLLEAHSRSNIQNLGLLPTVYVPGANEALQRQTWAGVPAHPGSRACPQLTSAEQDPQRYYSKHLAPEPSCPRMTVTQARIEQA